MAQVGCRARVDHRAPAAHMALPMVENRVTNEILEYGVARRRPCVVSEVLFGGAVGADRYSCEYDRSYGDHRDE
jgi:hypothetical protein